MHKDIIKKLKAAKLIGRGGGSYPTWLKWQSVAKAVAEKKHSDKKCFVVCNAAEGEPGVSKDLYIIEHYPERVIDGIHIAINFLSAESGFIYLNPDYYNKLAPILKKAVGRLNIKIIKKDWQAGYIGGEETAVLNAIEEQRIEPRLRPPFPAADGLWGSPTLINNVETLFNVSLVMAGKYEHKRFYTINGDCLWTGVYEYSEDLTIDKILRQTENYPDFDFFVQVGGEGSGEVLNRKQLKRPASGAGAITIYSMIKHEPIALMRQWVDFFRRESCGQCTPCREGIYRLKEILNNRKPDWEMFAELLRDIADTSFCGLGCAAPVPLQSYIQNVLAKMPNNKIKLPGGKKVICECLR